MKVGILDLTSPHWTAGGVFSGVVHSAVTEHLGGDNVCWVGRPAEGGGPRIPISHPPRRLPRILQRFEPSNRPGKLPYSCDLHGVDVVLPALYNMTDADLSPRGHVATVGWIPDFQHVFLPQFFSPAENATRDTSFRRCAELNDLVLLSSQTAAGHFRDMFPEHAQKASVAEFPSTLIRQPLPRPDSTVLSRYGLPEKFILVANQFWPHKNHLTVVRAAAELKKRNSGACLVLIGHLGGGSRKDGRCVFSDLLQELAREDLHRTVRLLGEVPRGDLVELLRHASAVLQPSQFEGWSTTIEDAKALGRPVICSDIATHREQAPQALAFFPVEDARCLADAIEAAWPSLPVGPDLVCEDESLRVGREMFAAYGQRLVDICQRAVSLRK